MKTHKYIKAIMISLLFGIILISYVSAYKLLCLNNGDSLPSNSNPRYTCEHDVCQVCATDNNYPTAPGFCKDFSNCNPVNGGNGGELDITPPLITMNSPILNNIYSSTNILFDITTNEEATLYYTDNINGRGRWSRLVNLATSFKKGVRFKDGLNNITLRATDSNGNSNEITKTFYVDSQRPKITKVEPKKGFSDGKFDIWFTEQNPSSLVLTIGNQLKGRKTVNVPIGSCSLEKGKYFCSVQVTLNEYNGQTVDYSFKLTDIAGSYFESKPVFLKVDTTKPTINNPTSLFTINGKYANLKMSITEDNLDFVSYYDNYESRPKWKTICTKLNNGFCEKKLTLKTGEHIIDLKVLDEAGNEVIERVSININ
jgi:hypothetical protein